MWVPFGFADPSFFTYKFFLYSHLIHILFTLNAHFIGARFIKIEKNQKVPAVPYNIYVYIYICVIYILVCIKHVSVFFVEYYGYYFVCILRAVDPSLRAKNKEHTSSRDVCFVKTGRKMMRRAVQMHILNMLEGWASFKTNL